MSADLMRNKAFILSLYNTLNGHVKEGIGEEISPSEHQHIENFKLMYQKNSDFDIIIESQVKAEDAGVQIFYNIQLNKHHAFLQRIEIKNEQNTTCSIHVNDAGILSTAFKAGRQALITKKQSEEMLDSICNLMKQVLPDLLKEVVLKRLNEQAASPDKMLSSPAILGKTEGQNACLDSETYLLPQSPMLKQKNQESQPIRTEPSSTNHQIKVSENEPLARESASPLSTHPVPQKKQEASLLAFKKKFENEVRSLKDKKEDQYSGDPKAKKEAYDRAQALCLALNKLAQNYWKKPSQEAYIAFQRDSILEMEQARVILDKHRGVRKILTNIAAIILSAGLYGLVVVADRLIKGKFTLFSTHSSIKVDAIEETFSSNKNSIK